MRVIDRRHFLRLLGLGGTLATGAAGPRIAAAQTKTRLAIATGGTGGVYYPLGGGIAALISKYIPGVEATAEVTTGSVDNMKLIHTQKVALAFTMPDTALDARDGKLRGLSEKVAVCTLAATYANLMHIVALDGAGIQSVADLKGKRVSTGSPGSGTEVKGLRVLEAYGLTPRDFKSQDRLGVAESAGALKDKKIDAFIWDGGLPTAAVLDVAATPGVKIVLVPHGDAVARMNAKYGNLYFAAPIPKGTYRGVDVDTPVAIATNLLVAHEKMDEALAYHVTKLVLERTEELVAVHKAAREISLKTAMLGSPIPFHPGALRYYKEKGLRIG
jgi:TRAP transporter TAXI family solute receptor